MRYYDDKDDKLVTFWLQINDKKTAVRPDCSLTPRKVFAGDVFFPLLYLISTRKNYAKSDG